MTDRRRREVEHLFHCSFCGKTHKEVEVMISGPRVFICDECVCLAVSIVCEKGAGLQIEVALAASQTEEEGLAMTVAELEARG